jgi:hypothetical protein
MLGMVTPPSTPAGSFSASQPASHASRFVQHIGRVGGPTCDARDAIPKAPTEPGRVHKVAHEVRAGPRE